MGIGTSEFPMGPMGTGMRISDCRYMRMGTGIQIREWEYNNGNEFPKLNGNQLLFAIACDVLASLQYALDTAPLKLRPYGAIEIRLLLLLLLLLLLGLVADAAITLAQFDISD